MRQVTTVTTIITMKTSDILCAANNRTYIRSSTTNSGTNIAFNSCYLSHTRSKQLYTINTTKRGHNIMIETPQSMMLCARMDFFLQEAVGIGSLCSSQRTAPKLSVFKQIFDRQTTRTAATQGTVDYIWNSRAVEAKFHGSPSATSPAPNSA